MKNNKITLHARYGLKHVIEQIDENTFRAFDSNRFSFDKRDEEGHYVGVTYIDFDGGPFIHVDTAAPWNENKIVKDFVLHYEGEAIPYIDIITEDKL